MILDHIDNAERYFALNPGFAEAFEWLRKTPLEKLEAGKHEIAGERLFVVMNRGPGKGRSRAQLEAHRRYIDIQYTVHGTDDLGWRPTPLCKDVTIPFNEAKDITFYGDPSYAWLAIPPEFFVILFPEDALAPMGAECDLVKAVVKVEVAG